MTVASVLPRINQTPKAKPGALAKALAQLDITPFNKPDVEKYKAEELETTFAHLVRAYKQEGFTDNEDCYFKHSHYYSDVRQELGPRWTDADRYCMMNFGLKLPKCVCMGWHRYEAETRTDIPDFVQRKMAQISAAVPGVSFETDVLESDSRPFDPFLIVQLGDEEYYVEKWGKEDKRFAV